MSGFTAEGLAELAALLPALGAVFVGCAAFCWLLALVGCRILIRKGKTE